MALGSLLTLNPSLCKTLGFLRPAGKRPNTTDWFKQGAGTLTLPQSTLHTHQHTESHTPWPQGRSEVGYLRTKRGCHTVPWKSSPFSKKTPPVPVNILPPASTPAVSPPSLTPTGQLPSGAASSTGHLRSRALGGAPLGRACTASSVCFHRFKLRCACTCPACSGFFLSRRREKPPPRLRSPLEHRKISPNWTAQQQTI